ncbi:MAG TPA: DoxX family protein, partial [Gemmatimonadaceae bacterium]|nr:DoxX family protein [Gemmatimonadaceae bacterium]
MKREPQSSDSATVIAIRISLALVFVLTGIDKIATGSQPHWVHVFDQIGIGQWFRYATASIEIIGGLLCLIPLTTTLGAAMLACTMIGAMSVHVLYGAKRVMPSPPGAESHDEPHQDDGHRRDRDGGRQRPEARIDPRMIAGQCCQGLRHHALPGHA